MAVALLAFPPVETHAADPEGRFAVDGVGSRQCEDFIKAVKSEDAVLLQAFGSWTNGFFTGANVYEEDTFDVTPWQTSELLLAKLVKYCEANPKKRYVNAVGRLLTALKPERLSRSSELVSPRVEQRAVFVYRETLERVREALVEAGYDVPETVAEFGPEFADALVAFQRDRKLPLTGLPDQPTLNALFQ
ncbi:MAG: peptidoglycan-binding protein [Gammaproteobacteria bacterium]|nr:peptidoglycan-binding protein [Gammaproteobacteria bacterium]